MTSMTNSEVTLRLCLKFYSWTVMYLVLNCCVHSPKKSGMFSSDISSIFHPAIPILWCLRLKKPFWPYVCSCRLDTSVISAICPTLCSIFLNLICALTLYCSGTKYLEDSPLKKVLLQDLLIRLDLGLCSPPSNGYCPWDSSVGGELFNTKWLHSFSLFIITMRV